MALIEAKNITKLFIMGETLLTVLCDISLIIKKGEFVALTGKSGSGKTTLMNILGCLDVPTKGTYLFEEQDVSKMTPDELAYIRNKKVGFVFQHFHLLPDLTALDNVALPQLYAGKSQKESRKRAQHLLELVELGDRMFHYPYQLSGGQRQRVAIARGMVNDPSVLLADEPTGNVDSKTGEKIMSTFIELNQKQNVTIILVTHDPGLAQNAQRVITLHDGKIIQDK